VRRSPIGFAASQHTASMMVLSFLFTVTAAQISWTLIEGPMNRLKRYLPYEADSVSERPPFVAGSAPC